jgi:TRAP-type mannitol/chloroaromatic compound transport system permease small subunit
MPHWLYWSGLALFPLFAMFMARRARRARPRSAVSAPLAYLFLLTGGFVGIHRFYLRNWLGVLYLPLFCGILYSNVQFRAARDVLSRVRRDLDSAAFEVEHWTRQMQSGVDAARHRLEAARATLDTARAQLESSASAVTTWDGAAMWLTAAIALFLLVDAVLLPKLAREQAAREPYVPDPGMATWRSGADLPAGLIEDPSRGVRTRITGVIDAISGWTGQFVACWSIIAVFVYYYEVMARYVFNSPTNWAHESMFLMFGMQYLLSGAFAYREDSHVRVDVIYVMLSDRAKAILDVVTSVFFFIFAATLLWTGWIFARDSIGVWEVSFTEWAIQYWPVKLSIALGAVLILLQGFAKLIKDVTLLAWARG